MLSTILWILGGVIIATVLIGIVKFLLVFWGVKTALNIVQKEVEELPKDYESLRKEVVNENATATDKAKKTARIAVKTGWRLFKHSREL